MLRRMGYDDINAYFKDHLNNDPDDQAAYNIGVDIGTLQYLPRINMVDAGTDDPGAGPRTAVVMFIQAENDLRQQLTSLNLADIINQIPKSLEGVQGVSLSS